ncbi:MAG: PfkB family carbohydrate kinase, partial [Armatimonadetes bacterium]|nr:PfkB family carbohydrate kinase [Armatimonadota bacterium]
MVLTVTLNASIDKTYKIESFVIDRINRPTECRTVPGGKGINVARVLKELGRSALATGFVGGSIGEAILRGLDEEGIKHDFVRVSGESRLCIK